MLIKNPLWVLQSASTSKSFFCSFSFSILNFNPGDYGSQGVKGDLKCFHFKPDVMINNHDGRGKPIRRSFKLCTSPFLPAYDPTHSREYNLISLFRSPMTTTASSTFLIIRIFKEFFNSRSFWNIILNIIIAIST